MLNFSKNKAIDVLLNTVCIDIGEDKLIEEIQIKRAEDIEKLFDQYDFAVSHSPDDVKSAIKEFNALLIELNDILAHSGYSIHSKALEELLEYSLVYKNNKAFAKTLDTIFSLVNEKRNNELRYAWFSELSQNVAEIRIQNERWRLYFTGKTKEIIAFDYEHKHNNHKDILPKIEKRLKQGERA